MALQLGGFGTALWAVLAVVFCQAVAHAQDAGGKNAKAGLPVGPFDVQGAYTQVASGMEFPPLVGDFQRRGMMRFNANGFDEVASYAPVDGRDVVVNVYSYLPHRPSLSVEDLGAAVGLDDPAVRAAVLDRLAAQLGCLEAFDAATDAISTELSGVKLGAKGEDTVTIGGAEYTLKYARYTANRPGNIDVKAEAATGRIALDLFLICPLGEAGWALKYWASYDAEIWDDDPAMALITALPITIPAPRHDPVIDLVAGFNILRVDSSNDEGQAAE